MKNKKIDKVKTQDQKFSRRDFLKSTTAVGLGITVGSSELLGSKKIPKKTPVKRFHDPLQ